MFDHFSGFNFKCDLSTIKSIVAIIILCHNFIIMDQYHARFECEFSLALCHFVSTGVIFTLKVLTTALYPHGIVTNWLELPIVCMMMPKITSVGKHSLTPSSSGI